MSKQVEFYFDVVSPASYLAWTQMPKLAQETGARVIYRPFFVPGLFDAVGSSSPITVPAKAKWLFEDLSLWAKKYDLPFVMNDRFPLSSIYAMRGLIAYQDTGHIRALGDGFFNAMWVENEDINAPEIVERIVLDAGIDIANYQNAIKSAKVKQAVFDATKTLKERGAFGAPTFFVGDKMFWGQDRLDFVKDALKSS